MVTRRQFLKTGAALAAMGALPASISCSQAKKEKAIGMQLWSVHQAIDEGFESAIESVVKIGYKRFESYGYTDGKFYGRSPKELKKYLAGLNAQMTGSHITLNMLEPDDTTGWDFWKKATADTAELGCKWIVQPRWPLNKGASISEVLRLAEQFNRCGEIAKSNGIKFSFHSWMDEFLETEGQIPYIVLLENTDPGLVSFEIDTMMMYWGGQIPHEFVKRFPGRFCAWHLKDVSTPTETNPRGNNTEIGKGIIDFKSIFEAFEIAGTTDYYVEQEAYSMPLMESMKYDYDYLNNASFVKW
jgi:Sugar phosphate isomerases/epimerases